jgi:chromate transporter
MPFARRMLIEQRRWMTAEEFNDAFSLGQFLPGPNMLNFAVVFGSRFAGPFGALAALAGLLGPPLIVIFMLGALYVRFGQFEALAHILVGLAAAAAGLILAASARMAEPLVRRRAAPAVLMAGLVFITVGLLRWPLIAVLLAATPISLGFAWWTRR